MNRETFVDSHVPAVRGHRAEARRLGAAPGKIGAAMKNDFDFSKDVAGIKATTLVVAGDADIFPPAHAVEVFGLLASTVIPFLDGPAPKGSN
jgi:pimeloyl-ACP methyl ester carboxylesterase